MTEVEVDRPNGGSPGTDQHGSIAQPAQVLDQLSAHSPTLVAGQDVCVTDQVHITHRLDAHDSDQLAIRLIAPELDPGTDLAVELAPAHVWLVPPIRWDDPAICLRGDIHDREDRVTLVISTEPNAAHVTISVIIWSPPRRSTGKQPLPLGLCTSAPSKSCPA